jgi:hypothetical protein
MSNKPTPLTPTKSASSLAFSFRCNPVSASVFRRPVAHAMARAAHERPRALGVSADTRADAAKESPRRMARFPLTRQNQGCATVQSHWNVRHLACARSSRESAEHISSCSKNTRSMWTILSIRKGLPVRNHVPVRNNGPDGMHERNTPEASRGANCAANAAPSFLNVEAGDVKTDSARRRALRVWRWRLAWQEQARRLGW